MLDNHTSQHLSTQHKELVFKYLIGQFDNAYLFHADNEVSNSIIKLLQSVKK
jgi:hypothetical protein